MTELEERWQELGEFIREQRHIGQLSLRKLSEMAGISNPYLSQIERGLRKPSAEILQQIARALQISAETLYVQAGILEPRDGEHDLVAEIRRTPDITEDQKKTLIHIYESFRAPAGHAGGAVGAAGVDRPAEGAEGAAGPGPAPAADPLADAADPLADADDDADAGPDGAGAATDPAGEPTPTDRPAGVA